MAGKARRLKRHWHITVDGLIYRKEKAELLVRLDMLDKKSETVSLPVQDREARMNNQLKWRQRAKEKYLEGGGGNIMYFHLKVCGRNKKNHISVLNYNGEEALGGGGLIQYVTEFYK